MKASFLHYKVGELLSRSFPKGAVLPLATGLAWAYARFFSQDIPAIKANLRCVFPGKGEEKLEEDARKVIGYFARYLTDLSYADRLEKDFIQAQVTVRGLDVLDGAIGRKKGVILTSAHLGNWEFGGMVLARLGYPIQALALRHRDPRINALFEKRRASNGIRIIYVGDGFRRLYRVLQKNGILGLMGDRLFVGKGVPVDFLGRRVLFPAGLSKISLFTGASVVPVFYVFSEDGKGTLDIQPPLEGRDPQELTQSFAARVEAMIRRHPLQWFIFQPFWEAPEWPM